MSRTSARLVAGVMSGTSGDGIDTALLRLDGDPQAPAWELLGFRTDPYTPDLAEEVLAAADREDLDIAATASLHVRLGRAYARALGNLIEQTDVAPHELDAVGLHGQTILHDPEGDPPVSVQIGSAAEVAEALGCDVVSDFRSRDLAVGGQGAPLVPFADAALLRSSSNERVALNIGGIANVTWLPAGSGIEGVSGFDTGPGNMVMDGLVRLGTGGKQAFDVDGELARRGQVVPELLETWLQHPFFERKPPRSTGREMFGRSFVMEVWEKHGTQVPLADLVATAAMLTVESIARACERFLPTAAGDRQVIVGGGGARNPRLMELLSERLDPSAVIPSDACGIPVDAREAIAFALLAYAFLNGVPANLPAVTGADRSVLLGSLTPGRVGSEDS